MGPAVLVEVETSEIHGGLTMFQIRVVIKKCENGYYIRVFGGFWSFTPQRFVAASAQQIVEVLKPLLAKMEA